MESAGFRQPSFTSHPRVQREALGDTALCTGLSLWDVQIASMLLKTSAISSGAKNMRFNLQVAVLISRC